MVVIFKQITHGTNAIFCEYERLLQFEHFYVTSYNYLFGKYYYCSSDISNGDNKRKKRKSHYKLYD